MTTRESQTGGGPDFGLERQSCASGAWPVAGVDEAGRGPWAGPVVAAAVLFPDRVPDGLDDSKKLTAERRAGLREEILAWGIVGIGIATVDRIDRDNILQATLWAMGQAIAALPEAPALALVDGNRMPALDCPARTVVRGDSRSLSIAAASIIAKTTRDRMMIELARDHPGYGWERNMGYGTAEHSAAIRQLGVTVHHRRSFAPIRAALEALTNG